MVRQQSGGAALMGAGVVEFDEAFAGAGHLEPALVFRLKLWDQGLCLGILPNEQNLGHIGPRPAADLRVRPMGQAQPFAIFFAEQGGLFPDHPIPLVNMGVNPQLVGPLQQLPHQFRRNGGGMDGLIRPGVHDDSPAVDDHRSLDLQLLPYIRGSKIAPTRGNRHEYPGFPGPFYGGQIAGRHLPGAGWGQRIVDVQDQKLIHRSSGVPFAKIYIFLHSIYHASEEFSIWKCRYTCSAAGRFIPGAWRRASTSACLMASRVRKWLNSARLRFGPMPWI